MKPSSWSRSGAAALAAAAVLAVIVLAFLWPSVTSTPHAIPVAVVGDSSALPPELSARFDFDTVAGRDSAIDAIESREAYGAIVLGAEPEVLAASADGPAVRQMLDAVAVQLKAPVVDIVPLSVADSGGTALSAMAFPLVIGGIVGGAVISMLVRGTARRLVATIAYGLAAGVVVVLITHTWFGIVEGSAVALTPAVGATVLSISALIVGLTSVIGPAGIAAGAVLMMFIGNQISGSTVPWQFLPEPWGAVGQYFPPGAGATLVRNLSYFPEASNVQPWSVLIAWSAAGVALMAVGHRKRAAALPPKTRAPEREAAVV